MSADKVQEAVYWLAEITGKCLSGRADSSEADKAVDALIAAVREDEREQAVARVFAIPTEESHSADAFSRGILSAAEAIRNAP